MDKSKRRFSSRKLVSALSLILISTPSQAGGPVTGGSVVTDIGKGMAVGALQKTFIVDADGNPIQGISNIGNFSITGAYNNASFSNILNNVQSPINMDQSLTTDFLNSAKDYGKGLVVDAGKTFFMGEATAAPIDGALTMGLSTEIPVAETTFSAAVGGAAISGLAATGAPLIAVAEVKIVVAGINQDLQQQTAQGNAINYALGVRNDPSQQLIVSMNATTNGIPIADPTDTTKYTPIGTYVGTNVATGQANFGATQGYQNAPGVLQSAYPGMPAGLDGQTIDSYPNYTVSVNQAGVITTAFPPNSQLGPSMGTTVSTPIQGALQPASGNDAYGNPLPAAQLYQITSYDSNHNVVNSGYYSSVIGTVGGCSDNPQDSTQQVCTVAMSNPPAMVSFNPNGGSATAYNGPLPTTTQSVTVAANTCPANPPEGTDCTDSDSDDSSTDGATTVAQNSPTDPSQPADPAQPGDPAQSGATDALPAQADADLGASQTASLTTGTDSTTSTTTDATSTQTDTSSDASTLTAASSAVPDAKALRKPAGEASCDPSFSAIDPGFQCQETLNFLHYGSTEMSVASMAATQIQSALGGSAVNTASAGSSQISAQQAAQQAADTAANKSTEQAALQAGFAARYKTMQIAASEAYQRSEVATQEAAYQVFAAADSPTGEPMATIAATDPIAQAALRQVGGAAALTPAGVPASSAPGYAQAALKRVADMRVAESQVMNQAEAAATSTEHTAASTAVSGNLARDTSLKSAQQIGSLGIQGAQELSSVTNSPGAGSGP